jgi:hypothetical protein
MSIVSKEIDGATDLWQVHFGSSRRARWFGR